MEEENKSALRSGYPKFKEYWALLKKPYGEEYGKDDELKSYSGQKYAYFMCDDKIATVIYFDYFTGGDLKNVRIINDVGEQRCEVRYILFMALMHVCNDISMGDLRKTPFCENFPFDVIASNKAHSIPGEYRTIREKLETDVLEKINDL